jgi:protein-disulfide isomerase
MVANCRFDFLTYALILLAIGTASFAGKKLVQAGPLDEQRPTVVILDSNQRAIVREAADATPKRIGTPGTHRIVLFGDFRCPASRAQAREILNLQDDDALITEIFYLHYPTLTSSSGDARLLLSECAASQDAFESYYRLEASPDLYAEASRSDSISYIANALYKDPIDRTILATCVVSGAAIPAVESDVAFVKRLPIRATPTIVLNDSLLVQGVVGLPRLRQLLLGTQG